MVIDDSSTDRFMTKKILEKARFSKSPIEFDFATKALEFLEDNRSHYTKLPQIILLDLNMISATINDDEIDGCGHYKNIMGFHSKPITVAFADGM